MILRLAAVFACLFFFASGVSKAQEGISSASAKATKLKRTTFARDKFAILIPPDYYTVEKGADVRTYTSSDYPHGLMSVMVATAPEHSSFSETVLKQLVDKLTPNKKSIDKESVIKLRELSGRQWEITNNVDSPQNGCLVRGFIAGRKLYILMAYGTKPWLNSTDIKQFMDSFELLSETN